MVHSKKEKKDCDISQLLSWSDIWFFGFWLRKSHRISALLLNIVLDFYPSNKYKVCTRIITNNAQNFEECYLF